MAEGWCHMTVRRKTTNRLTLIRVCGTCGKTFTTTADSPWIRQVPRDGKVQATTYYCCESCYAASYKHIGWFDGKAAERRRQKDLNRDPIKERERFRRYNEEHRDERREYAKQRRIADPGLAAADGAFYRKKRKLLAADKAILKEA